MTGLEPLAVALIVLPFFDWLAAAILGSVSVLHPEIRTLRERAVAAVLLALAATAGAFVAARYLHLLDLTHDQATAVVVAVLVLPSVPALYWLALLATGRLDAPERPE